MPLVTATLALPPTPEVTRRSVEALTALTVEALGKEFDRTTVVVHYVPPGDWARGGVACERSGVHRFVVEATITAGTNTRDEKARYVREVQSAFEAILGNGAAGYVVVREIGADAWGHGGETQEARYQRTAPA